jgi:hypothetical protein
MDWIDSDIGIASRVDAQGGCSLGLLLPKHVRTLSLHDAARRAFEREQAGI